MGKLQKVNSTSQAIPARFRLTDNFATEPRNESSHPVSRPENKLTNTRSPCSHKLAWKSSQAWNLLGPGRAVRQTLAKHSHRTWSRFHNSGPGKQKLADMAIALQVYITPVPDPGSAFWQRLADMAVAPQAYIIPATGLGRASSQRLANTTTAPQDQWSRKSLQDRQKTLLLCQQVGWLINERLSQIIHAHHRARLNNLDLVSSG